jgi:ArsR family transcriptional regulator
MSEPTGLLTKGQFDRIAKALADPRRFALLEAIASTEEYPCSRLCRDFPVTKATISHHIKELVRAGLIETDRHGQYMDYRVRREILAAYSAELIARTAPGHRRATLEPTRG